MDTKKLTELLEEHVLGKFLVNFIPGLLLFYIVSSAVGLHIEEGLVSLLILTTASWTLGIILEIAFFRGVFFSSRKGKTPGPVDSITLLLGKTGIAVLITCIYWIDLEWFLNIFDNQSEKEIYFISIGIKFTLFCLGGIFLYRFYVKQSRLGNKEE